MDMPKLPRSSGGRLMVRLIAAHIAGKFLPFAAHAYREVAYDIAEQKLMIRQRELDISRKLRMDCDLNWQLPDHLTKSARTVACKRPQSFKINVALECFRDGCPLTNQGVVHSCY